MLDFRILGSFRRRALFLALIAAAALLTLTAALRYATPLNGIPDTDVRELDSGWSYEADGGLSPLPPLPCRLDLAGDRLYLVRELSDAETCTDEVLTVQTRYQSIRVWADGVLIYEAAQGREHALSSMWHFIPSQDYSGASALRIELVKYDHSSSWDLQPVYQDHPDAIRVHILREHEPVFLVWLFCMLFTALLIFIILFMAARKIAGIPLLLSLTSFIFLSGTWILLDSKITTLGGGNYALTYFFSYLVFYLLPLPMLFYFQLILELRSRFARCLMWITAGNVVLWMLLHLLNVVEIRNTAWSVHLLIIVFLIVFLREFFRKRKAGQKPRLVCTFWAVFVIFAVALASIILYHAGLLPPANSAVLYAWGLVVLILCMAMDAILSFGRRWKETQYISFYRQLATEDSMTHLANRNAYELRLRELVQRPSDEVCFILLDIDQMKSINDTYGHQMGDEAIAAAAQCIRGAFGDSGGCYRIGGDEFCVILDSSEGLSEKLSRLDELVASQSKVPFPISVSYGWEKRSFGERAVTEEDIVDLRNAADKKLYRAKSAHRKDTPA